MNLLHGHVLDILPTLDAGSVQTCVTSPPYSGLRDYGTGGVEWPDGWHGELGLEPTPELYVEHLVAIFREVRRVLRDDGTLWLNLGDSYAGSGAGGGKNGLLGKHLESIEIAEYADRPTAKSIPGLKPKDLVGIPWLVAFALQADGWWLRSDIIWAKPAPMPESVRDRPTRAHEYIFLLSKSARYFYDLEAVREEPKPWNGGACAAPDAARKKMGDEGYTQNYRQYDEIKGANRRSVWTLNTHPFPEAHFATFPPKLPELCIKAGSAEGDVVLDPFIGSGTVGMVAEKLGRRWIGIDANAEYLEIAKRRLAQPTLWVKRDDEQIAPTP